MRFLQILPLILWALVACNRQPASLPVEHVDGGAAEPGTTYALAHNDVATVPTSITVDGKEIAILYSPASDQEAIAALKSLKPEIYLPNAAWGRNLFVVGTLEPAVHHTPNAPGMLASAPYRLFTLKSWFIGVPFTGVGDLSTSVGEEPTRITYRHLEASHFEEAPVGFQRFEKGAAAP